jgi:hypothetical protein
LICDPASLQISHVKSMVCDSRAALCLQLQL